MINSFSSLLSSSKFSFLSNIKVPQWGKRVIVFLAILLAASFILFKPIKSLIGKITQKKPPFTDLEDEAIDLTIFSKENYIKEMMSTLNYARKLLDETKTIDGKLQLRKCINSIMAKCDVYRPYLSKLLRRSYESLFNSIINTDSDTVSDDDGTIPESQTLNTAVVKLVQLLQRIRLYEILYKEDEDGSMPEKLLKNKETKSGIKINLDELEKLHTYSVSFQKRDNMPAEISVKT